MYPKVRGAIREKYGTQQAFAKEMMIHNSTLSCKLRGVTDWSRAEIERACRLLDVPVSYFF